MATLRLSRKQTVSSTEMVRRFGEYLNRVHEDSERLFITRHNEIQAVLLGIEEFEHLAEMEELVEHLTIAELVEDRKDQPLAADLESLLRREGLTEEELRQIDPA